MHHLLETKKDGDDVDDHGQISRNISLQQWAVTVLKEQQTRTNQICGGDKNTNQSRARNALRETSDQGHHVDKGIW